MQWTKYLTYCIVAGVIAGIAFGLIVTFIMEPLIRTAICYEQTDQPTCTIEEGMVLRADQELVAFAASPVIGLALGLLFALIYAGFHPYIPGRTTRTKALVLASLAFLTVPAIPSIAMPPLPPGVANSLPTAERDMWYGIIALGAVLGFSFGLAVYNLLSRRGFRRGSAAGAALLIMFVAPAIPLVLYPGSTASGTALSDPTLGPTFQALSLTAQAILWAVLALVFSFLWSRAEGSKQASGVASPD